MGFKAQISAEFLVFIGMAFLIAIAFEMTSLEQLNDFRIRKENEAVKDLALKLQQELLIAATVEDGYVRIFGIPDKVDSINYTLATLKNNTITVQSKNAFYIVPVPRVIGNVSKGTNTINKTGGGIYIN